MTTDTDDDGPNPDDDEEVVYLHPAPSVDPAVAAGQIGVGGWQVDGAYDDATDAAARRHTCTVTVERIQGHLVQYADHLTPREVEGAVLLIQGLEAIATGRR